MRGADERRSKHKQRKMTDAQGAHGRSSRWWSRAATGRCARRAVIYIRVPRRAAARLAGKAIRDFAAAPSALR
jgi:hypothetical protein